MCVVGLLAALAMMLLNPPHDDFKAAKRLFWISAVLVWGLAVTWAHRSHYALPVRIGVAASIAAIVAACLVYVLEIVDKREMAATAHVATAANTPQYEYLMRVSQFLGGDELGLRERFDFSNLIKRNIEVQLTRMNYIASGHRDDFFYNNYSDSDQMIFWAKEGKYAVGPQGVNLVNVNDNDVLILVVTSKYNDAQRTLDGLIDSPFASEQLKRALADLKAQVGRNTEEMLHILDTRLHDDKRYFTEANANGSAFANVIYNDFVTHAFPLKPAASVAMNEVASELRGSQS